MEGLDFKLNLHIAIYILEQISYGPQTVVTGQTASLRVANDTLITVQDTKFIENIAYQGDFFSYKNRGSKMSNFAFGKGGGFSITFKGYTKRNKLIFSNIELTGNKARYGGGFYISFNDKAVDNTIHFTNFTIHENSNIHPHNSWDADESGGGGKIIFKSQNLTENNNITLRGFEFCQNTAIAGGGLSLEVRMGSCRYFKQHFDN